MSIMKKKQDNASGLKIEGMSIKMELIIAIVPIVAILLILLTVVTSMISRSIIIDRSNSEMQATLGKYSNYISGELNEIKSQADTLAMMVGATYQTASIDELSEGITSIVTSNDMVLGAGLWFEPNVYDPEKNTVAHIG